MTDEVRDEAGRLVSVVVDGQRFHRAPEAIEERSDQDGFTVPTWQDLRQLADHNFGLYAEAAAEVRSLRGVVQAVEAERDAARAEANRFHAEILAIWRWCERNVQGGTPPVVREAGRRSAALAPAADAPHAAKRAER